MTALDRQDTARNLGLFVDDTFIRVVARDDTNGHHARRYATNVLGVREERVSILTLCNDHPTAAAVDCVHPDDKD